MLADSRKKKRDKRRKRSASEKEKRFIGEVTRASAYRLPRPTILEDVQDVEEGGGSDELLGRLARRDATSILVIRGREDSQGEVLHVCGRCAVDGDGIG